MFINQAADLGLLSHDENSNILGVFPVQIRRTVVGSIAQFLAADSSSGKNGLSTASHVNWAMESLGQGFLLAADDDEAHIINCTEVYRKWLFDKDCMPVPIAEDKSQFFLQKILKHFSLLFQPRTLGPGKSNNKEQYDKQAELCLEVVNIYLQIGRELALSPSTWEVLLKLLIGILNQLYAAETNDNFASRLIARTLRVTFELVLSSHNQSIWETIQTLAKNWIHGHNPTTTMAFVVQWNALCHGLTGRVLSLLYGAKEGTPKVSLKLPGEEVVNLDLENSFVAYVWLRTLYLYGNPITLKSNKNFSEAMKGIRGMVKLMIGLSSPPDGNSILHLFGSWLFEAVKSNRNGFEEGTAVAMETLCSIFFTLSRTKFDAVYLASFYSCLSNVLVLPEGRVVISTLVSCREFFSHELEGSNVLLPFFVHAITNVLCKKPDRGSVLVTNNGMSLDSLREACIKILGHILCFAGHYGNTKLALHLPREYQTAKEANLLPQITTYSALRPHVTFLILKSLRSETNTINIKYLLSYIIINEQEDGDEAHINNSSSDFVQQCIEIILSKVIDMWPKDVAVVAFRTLRNLANFTRGSKRIPQASATILGLSKFVTSLTPGKMAVEEVNKMMVAAFRCMMEWILVEQWIDNHPQCVKAVLDACVMALGDDKKKTHADAREAADILVFTLLNNNRSRQLSSRVSEEQILNRIVCDSNGQISDASPYVRYFFFQNMIIAVIDNPFAQGGPTCTLLVREKAGKFIWDSKHAYAPRGTVSAAREVDYPRVEKPPTLNVRMAKEEHLANLSSYLDSHTSQEGIVDLTVKQMDLEKNHISRKGFRLDQDIIIKPPKNTAAKVYDSQSKFLTARALLNNLGIMNEQADYSLTQLNHTAPGFFSDLKILDSLSERYTMQVGVVYVGQGQRTESEILSNRGGSQDYQDFLSGLGWGVRLDNHSGFSGNLNSNPQFPDGPVAPYFADNFFEVIFQAPTLSPTSGSEGPKRETLTANQTETKNQVIIVWMEDPLPTWGQFGDSIFKGHDAQILVHPLPSGLFQVCLLARGVLSGAGTVAVLNTAVRKAVLPMIVRTAAIDTFGSLPRTDISRPFSSRGNYITDVASKYAKKDSIETLFVSAFQPSEISVEINPLTIGIALPSQQKKRPAKTAPSLMKSGSGGGVNTATDDRRGSFSGVDNDKPDAISKSATLRGNKDLKGSPSHKRFSLMGSDKK